MIYIFNNGRSYSDRRIYFIEPTAAEEAHLAELFDCYAKAWPKNKVGELWEHGFLIAKFAMLIDLLNDAQLLHSLKTLKGLCQNVALISTLLNSV